MKIDPDGAGMDAGRLARIDEHLRTRYLDPGKIAGCQVAVVRHNALAHFSSLGYADRERQVPVSEDTIWRLYSMTKPITGVALMTLYEQGHFQLTDAVTRWIPQWKALKVSESVGGDGGDGRPSLVDPQRPINVRDLMMHMSGLGYSRDNADLALAPVEAGRRAPLSRFDRDLETLVDRLADSPLRFHPGAHWLYSLGTDVCGRLVEIMSGRRFDQYLHDEIFQPLGMDDAAFHVPDDKVGRFAANYGRGSHKELVLVDDPVGSSYLTPPEFLSGGGGLVATMGDYLRFTRMLLNGGELDGRRILGPKTVDVMATNHLPGGGSLSDFALPGAYGEVGFDGMGFGLTMAVSHGPAATGVIGSPGEFMWGGAASTIFWVDPVEDLAVVFMTQLLPSGTFNFRGQLKALVYPSIVE